MKALIFGSGGYIGKHLVEVLRLQGHEVVAESSRQKGAALDPEQGLLRDEYALPHGLDVIFYLSQSPHYRELPARLEHVMSVNCFTAYRLAMMASEAGFGRFIYTSTGSVYEPSFLPLKEDARLCSSDLYALSKIAAERALIHCPGGLRICCARLFGVYGPDQPGKMVTNLCERLCSGQNVFLEYDPEIGKHSGIRLSMTYVMDVVYALIALAEADAPPQIVNLAGLEAPSIRELVVALAARLGKTPRFEGLYRSIRGYYMADSSLLRNCINLKDTALAEGLNHCAEKFSPNA